MHKKIDHISVLIAEDEHALRAYFVEYLQIFFTTVYQASCGREALEIYTAKKPDIIVADINMPNLDGLSMVENIRQHDKLTKVIIATAHSEKEKLLKAIELHLVRYLIKPIHSDTLKELLFSLVDEIESEKSTVRLKEGFIWDKKHHTLQHNGQNVHLTKREQRLLELMLKRPNRSISNEDIYYNLYEDQPEKEFSIHALTSLIKRLRTKLPDQTITSNYGVGYIMHTK
ncbi:MAG: DNA-binding response regulator [Sulfurimonas sp.]|nr:MAG: DNA-binding response regulator [Sulfurimonas sp.]